MNYEEIKKNEEIREYYEKGNAILAELGFTDHSIAHTALVATKAGEILKEFGYSDHDVELAKIAGFLHDIGNVINRKHHAEYGALLANEILKETDLPLEDRIQVVSAIANHDESTGVASDPVTSALIIADKSDVRRSRVREKNPILYDIHDRVNHAVTETRLDCNKAENLITLHLTIDETACTMYEYFDIFLGRMTMCSKAARILGAQFSLKVNGQKVL